MTYDEALEIIYILQANYPGFYTKQSAGQAGAMTTLWANTFRDYETKIVLNALAAAIIQKKDFPPGIAEINEQIVEMIKPQAVQMDGEQAWGEAQRLIRTYGTYIFPTQKEALLAEMDKNQALKMAIRACGGIEGMRMCALDQLNTLRAQFIRIYASYAKRQRDDWLLPDSLKHEIEATKKDSLAKLSAMTNLLADSMAIGGGDI